MHQNGATSAAQPCTILVQHPRLSRPTILHHTGCNIQPKNLAPVRCNISPQNMHHLGATLDNVPTYVEYRPSPQARSNGQPNPSCTYVQDGPITYRDLITTHPYVPQPPTQPQTARANGRTENHR